MRLFVHQVHQVRGALEDDFDAHLREYATALGKDGDARLLWAFHQAHGTGLAYRFVTITGVRDGAAYERLCERTAFGDLAPWSRRLDELQHGSQGKVLLGVPWSPVGAVDLDEVPVDATDREGPPALYMEDTGWPHAPLDAYTGFWRDVYAPMLEHSALLRIDAVFQTAHGSGRRPEAILLQRVIDHAVLLRLFEHDTPPEMRQPGTFMHDALQVRDQWESRLLRTARWSPLPA